MALGHWVDESTLERVMDFVRQRQPIPFELEGRRLFYNPDPSAPYHLTHSIPKLVRLADLVAPEAAVVFDVGAHVGLFSAMVAVRRPSAQIHAFEPTTELAALARVNTSGLEVVVQEVAVGERAHKARLVVNHVSHQTNSLLRDSVAPFIEDPAAVEERDVNVVCLDDYVRGRGIDRVDVLKVDVQGAEGMVFRGAHALLADCRQVFVEATWLDPSSTIQVVALARAYGFEYIAVVNQVAWGADLMLTRDEPPSGKITSVFRPDQIDRAPPWLPSAAIV